MVRVAAIDDAAERVGVSAGLHERPVGLAGTPVLSDRRGERSSRWQVSRPIAGPPAWRSRRDREMAEHATIPDRLAAHDAPGAAAAVADQVRSAERRAVDDARRHARQHEPIEEEKE